MKYWLAFVHVPELDQYNEIAKFAEDLGFHGLTLPDHLIMPREIKSRYPYSPDGEITWAQNFPYLDPWITIGTMSQHTSSLNFVTNVYQANLRDPLTVAKQVSTASVISGGRVACGVAVGWMKEQYDMVRTDFSSRGRRLDESIEVLKKCWTGDYFSHAGEFFDVPEAIMAPAPTADIPVWIGGDHPRALIRAADNDGWLGFPMDKQDILETLATFQARREENGKIYDPFDFCFCFLDLKPNKEELIEVEEQGANNYNVFPWMNTAWGKSVWLKEGEDESKLDVKKRAMERFAKVYMY